MTDDGRRIPRYLRHRPAGYKDNALMALVTEAPREQLEHDLLAEQDRVLELAGEVSRLRAQLDELRVQSVNLDEGLLHAAEDRDRFMAERDSARRLARWLWREGKDNVRWGRYPWLTAETIEYPSEIALEAAVTDDAREQP